MSHEYEEERDRNLAVTPVAYVLTADQAVHSDNGDKYCQYILGEEAGRRFSCHYRQRYMVQRGPVQRVVCHQHLARTVNEFWQIKPGRYDHTDTRPGYWVSTKSTVVVKMQDESGGWR
jgi:hypothetical protein